jgi:hypothetical protein
MGDYDTRIIKKNWRRTDFLIAQDYVVKYPKITAFFIFYIVKPW